MDYQHNWLLLPTERIEPMPIIPPFHKRDINLTVI